MGKNIVSSAQWCESELRQKLVSARGKYMFKRMRHGL